MVGNTRISCKIVLAQAVQPEDMIIPYKRWSGWACPKRGGSNSLKKGENDDEPVDLGYSIVRHAQIVETLNLWFTKPSWHPIVSICDLWNSDLLVCPMVFQPAGGQASGVFPEDWGWVRRLNGTDELAIRRIHHAQIVALFAIPILPGNPLDCFFSNLFAKNLVFEKQITFFPIWG